LDEKTGEPTIGDAGADAQINLARGTVVTNAKAEPMAEDVAKVATEFFGPDGRHGNDYTYYYNNIKNNGFLGWLKGFTEPVVVMTPMNIISEIAQPVSMAFRHFGNVAGGGVITSILYTALAAICTTVLNLIASVGWLTGLILMVVGVGLFIALRKNTGLLILSILSFVLGLLGLLQACGILSGVPIFQFGIPAVLSLYFDIFSGFVQALGFSLLSMVYIAGSCPDPAEAAAD
jgi:F-type H+-transporting ATPase subunit a